MTPRPTPVIDLTALLDKGIPGRLAELGVDTESALALATAMRELRFALPPPSLDVAYGGGFWDGFIVGVAAARQAQS